MCRGGSAWWSVGLIGFAQTPDSLFLGDPKVAGSIPAPDTLPLLETKGTEGVHRRHGDTRIHRRDGYIQYARGPRRMRPVSDTGGGGRTRHPRRLNTSSPPSKRRRDRSAATRSLQPLLGGATRPPARSSTLRSLSWATRGWSRKAARDSSGFQRPRRSFLGPSARGRACNGSPRTRHRPVSGCSRESPRPRAESEPYLCIDCATRACSPFNPSRRLPSWRGREEGSHSPQPSGQVWA